MTERPLSAEAARAADIWGADRIYPDGSFMFACHLFGYLDLAARCAPGSRVLDLACGDGYGSEVIADAVGSCIGVDITPALLADSSARYPTATFIAGDAMRLPFADASFDVVAALQVIEHVLPTETFVAEAARVLADDGVLYVTTPNIDRLPATASKEFNPHHVRDFNPADLRAALGERFEEVELLGQMLDESLPRVQALLTGAAREWELIPRVERVERIVRGWPGPIRVRARKALLRLKGVPTWPLPDAERARDAIEATDFRAVPPAEASGCIIAVVRRPRR